MSKNQYKQATKHFKIPVPGWDDGIWPDVELKKWQMVENMIMSSMRGNTNAIFREGDLRLRQDVDETYVASFSATGNEPALQGAIGGAFFNVPASIVWKGLEIGRAYYLYVKGSNNTFFEENDVVPISSVNRMVSPWVTLVAKVDLTGEELTIDRNPAGKLNARDLGQHVLDYDNPHGDKVVQDELLIRKHLAIGDGNDADLEFDVNGEVLNFKLSQLVSNLQRSEVIVDFKTGGTDGVVINTSCRVVFASVIRTSPDGGEVGEISIGFSDTHPDLVLPNQIKVWNTGEIGIPMRAMIVCN